MKRGINFKLGVLLLTGIFCMSISIVTFAESSKSISVGGYVTLSGDLYGTRSQVTSVTSVATNPDQAYLYTVLEAQDRYGNTLRSSGEQLSNRGNRQHTYFFYNLDGESTIIYGTLGVKGGTTYSSNAIFLELQF